MTPLSAPSGSDWWGVLGQFALLSLLSIGGAISTAPEMHRYLVEQHHWMTDAQFSTAVALAQAAPGPNLLFVAVLGVTSVSVQILPVGKESPFRSKP